MKQADILPGMPDALAKVPPRAREYQGRTLDEAIAGAHALVDEVLERYSPDNVFTCYSGGEDSAVLTHLMRRRSDALIHIDTGTGIPDTARHVKELASAWDIPLLHPRSPDSYEDLVLGRVLNKTGPNAGKPAWAGFPGPAAHDKMYQRLKERATDKLRAMIVGKRGRKSGRAGEMVFLAGMRWAESERRFRNASETDPDGAITWASPLVWWTEGHMREYRARYRCQLDHEHAPHMLCAPGALPRNEVTAHLHKSGDCQCGAFAEEGEIHGIELFYPGTAAWLHDLEDQARAQGDIPPERCTWGWGAGRERPSRARRLCAACPVPQIAGQQILYEAAGAS